jgi:hypothetical protein
MKIIIFICSIALSCFAVAESGSESVGLVKTEMGKFQLGCLEEFNGKAGCSPDKPCELFFKDNSKECKAYRSELNTQYLAKHNEYMKSQSMNFDKVWAYQKSYEQCLERVHTEVNCKTGAPCLPPYRNQSKECKKFREVLNSQMPGFPKMEKVEYTEPVDITK